MRNSSNQNFAAFPAPLLPYLFRTWKKIINLSHLPPKPRNAGGRKSPVAEAHFANTLAPSLALSIFSIDKARLAFSDHKSDLCALAFVH